MTKTSSKLSLFLVVLLIVSAIDSIRNLPSAALFGSTLIFFFLFAALIFFIPTALVSAELSSLLPDHGGVYHWMTRAFGDKIGMLAIWLQWINTMVWYPAILSFIAGVGAYLINPALVENKTYLILSILGIFWTLTFVNLFGVTVSAKINSFCVLIGTLFPLVVLIGLGAIWMLKGQPPQISLSLKSMIPQIDQGTSWISLTAIMASFLGIELAGVHVNDIHNPQKNFPKAIGISALIIIATMLFGSLSIAYILPGQDISLIGGVMQLFTKVFEAFHIEWAGTIITVLILIGTLGSIINWLISPAKGLLHAAEYGYLPEVFRKKNKYHVAYNILIAQGILVSLFCVVFFLVPTINAFYWFLTGLSTDLYMMMYILMFLSSIKLHYSFRNRSISFRIPGKTIGIWIVSLLGIFGCLLTIAVGFFPPEHIHTPLSRYALLITLGNILMISPVFLFYLYRLKNQKTN